MASDEEERKRTRDLTLKLEGLCKAELATAGDDDDAYRNAMANVLTALQLTVAGVLAATGVPTADFMQLVENAMRRARTSQPRGIA